MYHDCTGKKVLAAQRSTCAATGIADPRPDAAAQSGWVPELFPARISSPTMIAGLCLSGRPCSTRAKTQTGSTGRHARTVATSREPWLPRHSPVLAFASKLIPPRSVSHFVMANILLLCGAMLVASGITMTAQAAVFQADAHQWVAPDSGSWSDPWRWEDARPPCGSEVAQMPGHVADDER